MYFMCVGSCVPSSPALALHKYNFNSAAAYCLPEKRNSTWVRKMKLFHRQHAPLAIHRQLHDASTSQICRTLRLYSFNIILLSCHCFYLSQETIKSESKILNFFSLFVFIYFFSWIQLVLAFQPISTLLLLTRAIQSARKKCWTKCFSCVPVIL